MPAVLRNATFTPVLLESKPLLVSLEQRAKIRDILEIGASDTKFADKMYTAIELVLTKGSAVPPVITSLSPDSVVLGSPSFTLNIIGTGFKQGSVIIFNGGEEPTTVVSATHLSTGVDMSSASTAVAVPVAVLNPDGVISDSKMFEFISDAPAALTLKGKVIGDRLNPEPSHPIAGLDKPHIEPHKKTVAEEHHEKGSE